MINRLNIQAIPIEFLIHEAAVAQETNSLDKAEHLFNKVIALDPTNFVALHLVGTIRLQRGDAQGSVELLKRAIAANSSHRDLPRSWLVLGDALRRQNRLHEALDACAEAMRLQPELALVHLIRANIHFELGRKTEALTDYLNAQKLDAALLDENARQRVRMLEQDQAT